MPFYQNLFDQEFRANWVLGGAGSVMHHNHVMTFSVRPNVNKSYLMRAWNVEPFDLSAGTVLTLNYAYDVNQRNFAALAINIVAAIPAATTAAEVVASLNGNAIFAEMYQARVVGAKDGVLIPPFTVLIEGRNRKPNLKSYISNTSAEIGLQFNKKAPVAELPTYFERHTIDNRFVTVDALGAVLRLDEGDPVDQDVITAAGFDYTAMQADWQLLGGHSGQFQFKKFTYDGSGRVTVLIEYAGGSGVGDLGKRTSYSYTGANTYPDQATEMPHTLVSGDLVIPT
jgi:hypothetical protein